MFVEHTLIVCNNGGELKRGMEYKLSQIKMCLNSKNKVPKVTVFLHTWMISLKVN